MQACIIIVDYQTILLNMKNRFEIHKNFIGNVFIFIAPVHVIFFVISVVHNFCHLTNSPQN